MQSPFAGLSVRTDTYKEATIKNQYGHILADACRNDNEIWEKMDLGKDGFEWQTGIYAGSDQKIRPVYAFLENPNACSKPLEWTV